MEKIKDKAHIWKHHHKRCKCKVGERKRKM